MPHIPWHHNTNEEQATTLDESARAKRALITGITGQDGSYLSELLLAKGYEVHGIHRAASTNLHRIAHLPTGSQDPNARLHLYVGEMRDGKRLAELINHVAPDEIYHLAAQSHVKVSFEEPVETTDIVATGTARLLECVRNYMHKVEPNIRYYQAGTSEMFGIAPHPQSETTPFYPRSPYAAAKAAAHWLSVNFREAYDMYVANGILFNHESPRRGETYVTRKITRAAARIKLGLQDKLFLGNLEAKRDWGFAGDYVGAMWLMLQQDTPDDFVIATGQLHAVKDWLDIAFSHLDLDWERYVEIDPRFFRPTEVHVVQGDGTKAKNKLGWTPKVTFEELVSMMVKHDLALAQKEQG